MLFFKKRKKKIKRCQIQIKSLVLLRLPETSSWSSEVFNSCVSHFLIVDFTAGRHCVTVFVVHLHLKHSGWGKTKKGTLQHQEHRPVEPSACLMETPASVPQASGALCIYLNCFECLFKLLEKWKNHDYNFFSPSVCYLEGYFTWLSTAVDTTQVNPVIIRKPDRYERHYYLYFCIFTPVWFSENKRIQQLLYSSNSVRLVLPALF